MIEKFLLDKIDKLETALKFYADKLTWEYRDLMGCCSDPDCCTPFDEREIDYDEGLIARQALGLE